MSGEDQERFEDYLELERFIAELQAGHAAYPPQELMPTQARVYRMAMLFHSATPGVAEPDANFAMQLQARLEQELQNPRDVSPSVAQSIPAPVEQPVGRSLPTPIKSKRRLPRRWLLAGSVTAAASMVVGAGVDHMADMAMHKSTGSQQISVSKSGPEVTIKLVSPLDWFPVTTVAELGKQAVRFRAEDQNGSLSLTGYVVRSDGEGDNSEYGLSTAKGEIIAMSAVCTHKGCIVNWSSADRSFHCPCHGGVFHEDGGINASSSSLYLNPLPRLEVRVENGQIYVRMPAS